MFFTVVKALRIAMFTVAPAVAGWFLVYLINHPYIDHHHITPRWPPIFNWVVFGIAFVITVVGYVLDIREYRTNKPYRSQSRTDVRRLDTTRPQTGRRITDKQ